MLGQEESVLQQKNILILDVVLYNPLQLIVTSIILHLSNFLLLLEVMTQVSYHKKKAIKIRKIKDNTSQN